MLSLYELAVLAVFKHAGDDIAAAEYPFRLLMNGERFKETPLPMVTYDSQLVLLSDDCDNANDDARVCDFLEPLHHGADVRGLLAEVRSEALIPIGLGTFSIDGAQQQQQQQQVVVSPGTWHDKPGRDNQRGVRGWMRSFRRAERLAVQINRWLDGADATASVFWQVSGVVTAFQHLFREATVSRHGAALQSALALYERATRAALDCKRSASYLPIDNWTYDVPTEHDDHDIAERLCFANLSQGDSLHPGRRLYLNKRTLVGVLQTFGSYDKYELRHIAFAGAGHWVAHSAIRNEDPLGLVVFEAISARWHAASPIARRMDRLLRRTARTLGHPTVTFERVDRAWFVLQMMRYQYRAVRDGLDVYLSDPYPAAGGGHRESGLNMWNDSMHFGEKGHVEADLKVFCLRTADRKAAFYDRLDAWLDDDLLGFFDKAERSHFEEHAIDPIGQRSDIKRLSAMLDSFVTEANSLIKHLSTHGQLPTSEVLARLARIARENWAGPRLDRALHRPFSRSDAYTQDRQARICFRLASVHKACSWSDVRQAFVFSTVLTPQLTLDARHARVLSNFHLLESGVLSIRKYLDYYAGCQEDPRNRRFQKDWRVSLRAKSLRAFVRHLWTTAATNPDRVNLRLSHDEHCDALLQRALHDFVRGSSENDLRRLCKAIPSALRVQSYT